MRRLVIKEKLYLYAKLYIIYRIIDIYICNIIKRCYPVRHKM